MLTQLQRRERAEAIDARLRYVVAHSLDAGAESVYILPSTGKKLDFGKQKNGWKLSRLLYRVGELELRDSLQTFLATRPLLRETFDHHAFIRTLGIIGTKQEVVILEELREQLVLTPLLQRTLQQSILQLTNAIPATTANIPQKLDKALADATLDLSTILTACTRDDAVNTWLYALYLRLRTESPELLGEFRAHLATLPLRGNYFQPLRHIWKAAEQLRDDATVATLFWQVWKAEPESKVRIAYEWKQNRLGLWRATVKGKSAFHPKEPYDWQNPPKIEDTAASENTKWGFTARTRRYLLRRTYRKLEDLGTNADLRYPEFASNLLLQLNRETVRAAFEETHGRYAQNPETRRWEYSTYPVYHPEGADLIPLHWIVNGGSDGFEVRPDAVLISRREPFAQLRGRRERFAPLWDRAPRVVIRLLAQSTLQTVQEFALRIFRANPEFTNVVEPSEVLSMLESGHGEIAELAFDLLKARPELLTAAVGYALIVHEREPLRSWAKTGVNLDFDIVFSHLLEETDAARFERIVEWLRVRHTTRLNQLTDPELGALLQHPVAAAGLLAAATLRGRQPLPYAPLLQLMTSEHAEVRAAGVELFGTLPLAELNAHHRETIIGLCVSERAEVRTAAAPVTRRLAERYPNFGAELTRCLVEFLRMRGKASEVHDHIGALLSAPPLRQHLDQLPNDDLWRLIRSKKFPAQQVGFAALRERHSVGTLSTVELVELGRHEWADVRAFARERLEANAERTVYEALDFLRLLDTDWNDSREFAKTFLRERLTDRDWTPELLIAALDIPRADVQTFVLEFVERHVTEDAAEEFFLKMAQHPGREVQTVAAGWLERHAADKPEMIERLLPFFQTLLGQIARGRTAKDRVFDFLEKQSHHHESVARLVLPLLERLMLTIAVGDRARCWLLLNELRRRYPHLDSRLEVVESTKLKPLAETILKLE